MITPWFNSVPRTAGCDGAVQLQQSSTLLKVIPHTLSAFTESRNFGPDATLPEVFATPVPSPSGRSVAIFAGLGELASDPRLRVRIDLRRICNPFTAAIEALVRRARRSQLMWFSGERLR